MCSTANQFYTGDVLYSRLRPYLNKVWCADRDGLCSSEFIVLPGSSTMDSAFLRYRLSALDFVNFANSLNSGDRPRVNFKQISSFILPPFSLARQRRIVDAIDTLFARLDKGEAALREVQNGLARYRQSVLKAAVTGELTRDWREKNAHRLEHGRDLLQRILETRRANWQGRGKYKEPAAPDTADLPELPEGWVWVSAGHLLAAVVTGPFGSALHKSDYVSEGSPLVNPININEGEIVPDSNKCVNAATLDRLARYQLKPSDIVIARRGDMGRCAAVHEHESGWLCGTGTMILRPTSSVHPDFLSMVIRSYLVVSHLESKCVGTTMKNLNQKALLSAPIAIPGYAEQCEVLRAVDEAWDQIEHVEEVCQAELTRSQALRQSILKEAFAGRLVPQDPNDEPASELLARIRAEREADKSGKKKHHAAGESA